jgi:predicted metalloprotease
MRSRLTRRTRKHHRMLRRPIRLEVSQDEILADLIYPASAEPTRRRGR